MEAELEKSTLLPTPDRCETDIERFVERHLGVSMDQYASDLPAGVLGLTEFFQDGSCRILISRALSDEVDRDDSCPPGIRGRWRATMAHEAAHVLLHRGLYVGAGQQTSIFESKAAPPPERLFRCSNDDVFRLERTGVRIPVDPGGRSGVIRARVPVDPGAVGAKRRVKAQAVG